MITKVVNCNIEFAKTAKKFIRTLYSFRNFNNYQ